MFEQKLRRNCRQTTCTSAGGALKVKGPKPTTEMGLYLECSRRIKEDTEAGSCFSLWDECKEVLEIAAGQMGGFKSVVSPGGSGVSIIMTAAISFLPPPCGLQSYWSN